MDKDGIKKKFNDLQKLIFELNTADTQTLRSLYRHLIKEKSAMVKPLIHILRDKRNPKIARCRAAYVLGKIRDARAYQTLLKIAQDRDEDEDVRFDAIVALGDLRDIRAIPFLVRCVQEPYSGLTQAAAMALKNIGSPSIQPLAGLLNHPDPEVRAGVVYILGGIGGRHVIRLLKDKLKDENEEVRVAVAEALAELFEERRYRRAADVLKLMVADPSQCVQKVVKYWLKELRIE